MIDNTVMAIASNAGAGVLRGVVAFFLFVTGSAIVATGTTIVISAIVVAFD